MKISNKQLERLANMILDQMISHEQVKFKTKEEAVRKRAFELLKNDFDREAELDIEVNKMMDDLERQNPGSFQRYKMFPLLKKRLAKEKAVVL